VTFHNTRHLFSYHSSGSPSSPSVASYCHTVANEQCNRIKLQAVTRHRSNRSVIEKEFTNRGPRKKKGSVDSRCAPRLVCTTTKFDRTLNIPSTHKRRQRVRQLHIIALKTRKSELADALDIEIATHRIVRPPLNVVQSPPPVRRHQGPSHARCSPPRDPCSPSTVPASTRCFAKRQYPVDVSSRGGGGAAS
jgi:hypothetical protein